MSEADATEYLKMLLNGGLVGSKTGLKAEGGRGAGGAAGGAVPCGRRRRSARRILSKADVTDYLKMLVDGRHARCKSGAR